MREWPLCRLDDLQEGQARGFDPLQQGRDSCSPCVMAVSCGSITIAARIWTCAWSIARTVFCPPMAS